MGSSSSRQMWTPTYVKLLVIELCIQIGMQMVQPITSNAALQFGATVTLAGIIAGTCYAVSLALRFVSGRLLSMVPLKKMLVAAAAVFCLSSIAVGIFNNIAVLETSRVFYGVAIVFKTVLGVAICVRIVPEEFLGRSVAWLTMMNIFSSAIGPALAQYIGTNFGYGLVFLLSSITFALAFVIALTFPDLPLLNAEKSDESQENTEAAAEQGELAENGRADGTSPTPKKKGVRALLESLLYFDTFPIAVMGVCEALVFGVVNSLTLTVGDLRGMPEMSLFFIVYVIVAFAARPVLGKLYDQHGFNKVCLPTCVAMTLAMVTFAFTDSLPWIIVDGALFALGQGCLWPILQAESVKNVPADKSSLAANTFLVGVDLGITIGPMVGGAMLDATGPMGLYFFATAVGVCLIIWVLIYMRKTSKRAD